MTFVVGKLVMNSVSISLSSESVLRIRGDFKLGEVIMALLP